VIVTALDRPVLARIEAAARAGEPMRLSMPMEVVSRATRALGLRVDELVPYFHAVDDPALRPFLAPEARGSGVAVSVVIPTHRQRPLGLDAFGLQDVETEVIVLANGDYDEGVRVPWEGHGPTRNRSVALARFPYVCFSVDDALPLGAGFLRAMVEALEESGADAVSARQVPWPTADTVTRLRLRAWTPAAGRTGPLDNVCALYRREALVRDPFDAVPIAEDWLWGRRHRVGYAAGAPVAHSHPRRFRDTFARTRDIHRERIRAGEAPRVPDAGSLLRALPSTLGRDMPGALGELLGQWAAGR